MSAAEPTASRRTRIVEGIRVSLVTLLPEDLIHLQRWFVESIPERQTCRPVIPKTHEERLAGFIGSQNDDKRQSLAVIQNRDHALAGRVSYFDLNARNMAVEIGYTIGTEFRNQGYGREAVGLLLAHLFETGKVNKVMAQTGEFNHPSVALLTALGFHLDGRLRQHHELAGVLHDDLLFSILRRDYEERT